MRLCRRPHGPAGQPAAVRGLSAVLSANARIYAGAAACVVALVGLLALLGGRSDEYAVEVLGIESAGDRVVVQVAGRPDPALSHIAVYDADRTLLNTGPVTTVGDDGLAVPIRHAGDVEVAYHIVTVDGRTASGAGDDAPAGHAHDVDPVGATLLVVDALALAVAGAMLVRRRPA